MQARHDLLPEGHRLPKRERMHLKRSIDEVFTQGKSFVSYPLCVYYLIGEEMHESRAQMMVSVPKKYFRRAVKRNRIKRLIREAYRLNKQIWLHPLQEQGLYGRIALISVCREMPSYSSLEQALVKALRRISGQITNREDAL